ncbi:glycosyltransferase [Glutamicibacter ardleyensis]|uniref:glycosyltransferase n=1 Tax=Glutamicibacter ardleyensis TaxID=225894 RepID=UPI003FD221BB
MMKKRSILLYGDVNLNIIDGSAIWLTSISEVVLATGAEVHVLLKTPVIKNEALDQLKHDPDFYLHEPLENHSVDDSVSLSPRLASQRILALDTAHNFDAIIARGMTVCKFIAISERLHSKAWLYVTDLPFPIERVSPSSLKDLETISERAFRLFSQTEESRSYLEVLCPVAAGKTLIMSPMIPDDYYADYDSERSSDSLSLVYAGKFAEDWNTLEMLSLPNELSELGANLNLTMIGNKFQHSKRDPQWHVKMEEAIESPEISWHGGLSRYETMLEIRKADLGLGWRSATLDSSMEISTKALEYAASGVPPLLNRTQAHVDIFGADYPFFVDHTVRSVHKTLMASRHLVDKYRDFVRAAVGAYSMEAAIDRFTQYFDRIIPRPIDSFYQKTQTNIVIAGHDFKFCGELIEYLSALPNVNLTIDRWATLHTHDEAKSLSLLTAADIVICEWAGPNSVWYSNNVRPDQKLFVRLHAFELRGGWIGKINFENVTQLFCVSELYADMAANVPSWTKDKISVIPNLIDVMDLNRAKLNEAAYHVGLVGIVPFIKRPDRALDLLELLLEVDERYSLHIRGRMPWEYPYEWNKGLQRFAYEEFFERIASNPLLAKSVVFEDFGSDIASWYRKIGVVLSPSTRESFHLAPVEGMAGGAVPVVWDRPGAVEVFSKEFVFPDLFAMKDYVLSLRDVRTFASYSSLAKKQVQDFDIPSVMSLWHEYLFGSVGV